MKRGSTFFLRLAIIAIATIVLAICIFALPAIWKAVAVEYPSITYVFYYILSALYIAAIPFYVALYQAMKLLNYIDRNKAFSKLSVRALRNISYCAVVISFIFATVMPFFYVWAQNDDAPGLVVISMFLVVAPFTIAVFAAVLQRLFSDAIAIKSENDLTV